MKDKKINLFVCGPTVYDFAHIGHARSCIIFDCFVKFLRHAGYKVFYLQNITDIDDKIIAKSKEKGVLVKSLAKAFEKDYIKDMKSLGVDSVNTYARATDYIKEIINQIKRLLDKGYAYKLEDGVYYDIKKFKDYGKLSGRTALQADDSISRIDYSGDKKNRGDFCLWKLSIEHEPSWPSPFGKGRPGWHIEDTAITEKFFGSQYDIHGGGRDLMFPHHEAEISQMEAISGKVPLAKYWMHTGFLTFDSQKMSKSLHNFITIDSFLKRHPYRHLRFWVAKNLWRSPLNYSDSVMIETKSSVDRIEDFLRKIQLIKQIKDASIKPNSKLKRLLDFAKKDFYKNLSDDFNTPKAFATIFDLIKDINRFLDLPSTSIKNPLDKKVATEIYAFFEEINSIFDIIDFGELKYSNIPNEVSELVKKREEYRKNSQWDKADEVRKEIEKYGYLIEDTKEGPALKKIENRI